MQNWMQSCQIDQKPVFQFDRKSLIFSRFFGDMLVRPNFRISIISDFQCIQGQNLSKLCLFTNSDPWNKNPGPEKV